MSRPESEPVSTTAMPCACGMFCDCPELCERCGDEAEWRVPALPGRPWLCMRCTPAVHGGWLRGGVQ